MTPRSWDGSHRGPVLEIRYRFSQAQHLVPGQLEGTEYFALEDGVDPLAVAAVVRDSLAGMEHSLEGRKYLAAPARVKP